MSTNFMPPLKVDESLKVTVRNDIYPAIDPTAAFAEKAYAGQTVLVTGASRGIGQTIALFFAKAGANVALVARSSLEETTTLIEQAAPRAQVAAFAADVRDAARAEEIVAAVAERFGGLNVLVANAGTTNALGKFMGDQDAKAWWNTFEVNVLGVYSYVRPSVKHLATTAGRVLIVSSVAGISRLGTWSDYNMSKHVLIRLAEMVALEYPAVKAFAFHAGNVETAAAQGKGVPKEFFVDAPELAAGTALVLASGRFDWLSARFVDSTWDLGEVEKMKDAIVEKDALICRLALP